MCKPECVKEEHLQYLDELRESGTTNMFGAGSYVKSQFPELTSRQVKEVLVYWMGSFSDRHDGD